MLKQKQVHQLSKAKLLYENSRDAGDGDASHLPQPPSALVDFGSASNPFMQCAAAHNSADENKAAIDLPPPPLQQKN